jgi:hypothetical protein
LDSVVAVLANESITDGRIEKHVGCHGAAKQPGKNDVANPVGLMLKLCHFGGGYRSLYVEQQGDDVRFVAHLGATPKIRAATIAAK